MSLPAWCNGSRFFPPEILTLFPGEFRSLAMGFGGIPPGPSSRRIWSALRAVFAFECPRPPLRDFTIEMGEAAQSRKPSGADESAGGFCSADFSGASPVASALGIRSGATPRGRSMPRSVAANFAVHSNASVVASSNAASSTICALRSAASRKAVMASLLTLRGIPLVT